MLQREIEAGRAALSTQVLQEFYVNVTRKLASPLPSEVAEARVRDFSELPLVRVDTPLILAAIARSRSLGFSFWDALIVEAALAGGRTACLQKTSSTGRRSKV